MCDALRKLMQPEFDEALDKALDEASDNQAKETARKMIRNNMPDDEIIFYTGLNPEQIAELRKENKKAVTA